jgi:chromosome segregation ATPase
MFITGCCTATTDPRRGGLFSYCPKAYQERLDHREKSVIALERSQKEQQEISRKLEEEARARHAILDEQTQQLALLDENIANIQRKIHVYQKQTKAKSQERLRLEEKLRLANEQVRRLQAEKQDSPQELAVMEAKIQKLKQEIEELLQLTLQLTQSPK